MGNLKDHAYQVCSQISPNPPIPRAAGSRTPPSPTSSDFGPKQPKPEGPHPEIELIKPAAAPPTGPNPFLAMSGNTASPGCTGSKLGFHSYPPQIHRPITAQKPNTMLIKSATRGPGKSLCPIQGNQGSEFQRKTADQAAKGRKAEPQTPTQLLRTPQSAPPQINGLA